MLPSNSPASPATLARRPARPRQTFASLAAFGLLLTTAMPALAQCPVSFAAASNYSAPSFPTFVALSDFNADGRPDLAVASFNGGQPGNVYILRGNGGVGGTFQAAVPYGVGLSPVSVAVGDFNADGRPDLAVANQGSNNVSILRGNGNSTFQAAVNYAVGTGPTSVAVGDFNADGRPDLAVANRNSNNVSILLGNVSGTFQAAVNYAVGTFPLSVAVGDFNGDGRPDLAVANQFSNNVSILLGNVSGTFQAAVNYTVGTQSRFVAAGDFNFDGRLDLVVANGGSSTVSILLGNGNGTFQAAVNYAVGANPVSVAVGDFNIDGRPDLAVANGTSNNVSILLGNGNGTFQARVDYALGSSPQSVAVGDFNADGRPDLAVPFGSGNVSVLLNATPNLPEPTITQQPIAQAVLSGSAAVFTAAATSPSGAGTLAYQWRRNGVNLANVSGVSGATSPTLTINPAPLSDNGSAFDCVVTNACGSVRSNPAGLAVISFCLADVASDGLDTIYNPNGSVGPEDLDAFIAAFIAGC